MGYHLRYCPIQRHHIRPRHYRSRHSATFWCNGNFQSNIVITHRCIGMEVRKYGRVLDRSRRFEWFQCLECNDPRWNWSSPVLSGKWAEGNWFPFLNVSCAPIVDENEAKHVILSGIDVYRASLVVPWANKATLHEKGWEGKERRREGQDWSEY